jgi:hypothetical protein
MLSCVIGCDVSWAYKHLLQYTVQVLLSHSINAQQRNMCWRRSIHAQQHDARKDACKAKKVSAIVAEASRRCMSGRLSVVHTCNVVPS